MDEGTVLLVAAILTTTATLAFTIIQLARFNRRDKD